MEQIVKDYRPVKDAKSFTEVKPKGDSCSPKGMVFHMVNDKKKPVSVLDIGFGSGSLGAMIKNNPETSHWAVDGVDGFEVNCYNPKLYQGGWYRNVWHGLAQDLPSDQLKSYEIICLLDVIEHVTIDTARWLIRTLLGSMGEEANLFISTPLWFFPQDNMQSGDLEEHLIGVPATSMVAMLPTMYSINESLVGGFVYEKKSLEFADFFVPTADKGFTKDKGFAVAKAAGLNCNEGVIYFVNNN